MSQTSSNPPAPNGGEIILYRTEDGRTCIQCRIENETLWLTQAQIAALFQTTAQNVTLHLKAIFADGELDEAATCKDYLQVRREGHREIARNLRHYRLEAILAVGYRVRSHRGTQFRQWATGRLSEYLLKGFTMDDKRLKNPPGKGQKDYFDKQLERIRDIRSSERRFYQKVLDIYATSVDYTPNTEMSQEFFATVQNKMHWATHGHTAAEVIHARADAGQRWMGLKTARPGGIVRREDVSIAKNYLNEEELHALNRIVNAYLEFAEVQALNRRVMTMRDWIAKLDAFLKLSGRELLDHAGKVSHEAALAKAEAEHEKFRALEAAKPSPVEFHFQEALEHVKQLQTGKNPRRKKKP